MKTLEQFQAEQREKFERESALHAARLKHAENLAAAGLPIPPYIADGKTHGAAHVAYWNQHDVKRTMSEALDLVQSFGQVLPFHVLNDGCFCTMHPETRMPPKKGGRNPYVRDSRRAAGYAFELRVTHRVDGGATSAELAFFALLSGCLYSVSVAFGNGYIGNCGQLAPRIETERDARTGRVLARKILPNADAFALADQFVSYSYGGDVGPLKSGADHRFLFVADTDDDSPSEFSHALAQLRNLAEKVKA